MDAGGKGKEGEIASIYGGKFRSETDDAKFDQVMNERFNLCLMKKNFVKIW